MSFGGIWFPQGSDRSMGPPPRPAWAGACGSHLRGWRGGAGVERVSEEESLVSVFTHAELLGLRCWFVLIRIHWELFNRIFSF